MKKFSLITALVIVSFILQTSLFKFISIFGVAPNLSLIIVVIFAMMTNGVAGGLIGIMTGVLYDILIYDVFGIYTLIYFIIGSIIGTYNDDMFRENYAAYVFVTGFSTIISHFFLYVILYFLRFRFSGLGAAMPSILFEVILNSILVVFVLKFILFLSDKLKLRN